MHRSQTRRALRHVVREWDEKSTFRALTDAARRVFVRALCVGPELAVLVAASVGVFGPQQPGVALLLALHAQVAAERLLRLGEATGRFRKQYLNF